MLVKVLVQVLHLMLVQDKVLLGVVVQVVVVVVRV